MQGDLSIPDDLYYTESHLWLFVEDTIGTIGITDFGQYEHGEIVFIELPDIGSEIVQDMAFGTIEAKQTAAELIAPVSGEVIEKNEQVESNPKQINSDPYDYGWMIKILIHNPDEIRNILTPQDYNIFISDE